MKPGIFDYTSHTELWKWLAEDPSRRKDEWPYWQNILTARHYRHCFACAAAANNCDNCPLKWNGPMCTSENAEYLSWSIRPTRENALAIADLPLNPNFTGIIT